MDNQTNQPVEENTSPITPSINKSSDNNKERIYIAIISIVVLILVGLAVWYFIGSTMNNSIQPSAVTKEVMPALSSGDTNADIANDLNKIPNDSAALTKDQNSINTSIQGL